MKYKGIEIYELKTTFIKNLPREMLVWNDNSIEPKVNTIVGACVDLKGKGWYIADDNKLGIIKYCHCAEIPEEPKPRRATNRELARWLAQGNGQIQYDDETKNFGKSPIDDSRNKALKSTTVFEYFGADDFFVIAGIKVRKWDDTEWNEPDVQYMGLET